MTALTPNDSGFPNPGGDSDEAERLAELGRYGILDTPPEQSFDDLVRLAACVCHSPIAAISFIDFQRQWIKAGVGLDLSEWPRPTGLCQETLRQTEVHEVADIPPDPRLASHPLVHGQVRARFYAGVPLVTDSGHALGTLFVLDVRPRELTAEQKRLLGALGRQTVALLEIRRASARHSEQESELHRLRTMTDQRVQARTADLKAANEQLEAFAYSVSHDLCSPLRAIDHYSQGLIGGSHDQLSDETRRQLSQISQNVRQMRQLITGLLQFSRFSRQPLHKRRISPAGFVRQILDGMQAELKGRGAVVEIQEMPDCDADPLLLKQLFVNLLGNALKFTRSRQPARILVGSDRRDGETVYFVRDNGVGFDMQYRDRLFGVFQRLHRSEEFEGTGVGLSIVKRIVHRHGGRVWAVGQVNEGATFYFTLPV